MHEEDAKLEKIIGFGRYQIWHTILFQWISILQACNISFMAVGKYLPPIDCQACRDKELPRLTNITIDGSAGLRRCVTKAQFHSVAIEWRLYCSNGNIPYVILTVQMVGILIGSLVFGQLSDSHGRRKVLLVALFSQLVFGIFSSFSSGWRTLLVMRFLLGLFGGGTHTTNQVYFVEVVNARHRLWLSNVGGWPLGLCVFVCLSWLTKEWRSLTFYSNLLCIPTFILLCYLEESPRWCLQNGFVTEAERTLRKFLRAQHPNKDAHMLEKEYRALSDLVDAAATRGKQSCHPAAPPAAFPRKRYTYCHLLVPSMRRYAFVVALTHCVAHGIMFHADSLSGDIYLNLFLLAAFRWLMNTLTIFVDTFFRCGRKPIYIFPSLAITISCSIIVVMGHTSADARLALTAAAFSSPLWISTLLWPVELFPTPVRNLAASFGAVFDRLAGITIPQILIVGKQWPTAPYAVFAFVAVTGALAVGYILPETKGSPLPERMMNADGQLVESGVLMKQPADRHSTDRPI